jgi:hypothetical protein
MQIQQVLALPANVPQWSINNNDASIHLNRSILRPLQADSLTARVALQCSVTSLTCFDCVTMLICYLIDTSGQIECCQVLYQERWSPTAVLEVHTRHRC